MAKPVITVHDAAGVEITPGTSLVLPTAEPGVETAPTVFRIRNNSAQGADVDPARSVKMSATARPAGATSDPVGEGLAVLDDRIVIARIVGATGGAVVSGLFNTALPLGRGNVILLGEIPGSVAAGYGEIEVELTVIATINASSSDSEVVLNIESRQTFALPTGQYERDGNFVIAGDSPSLPDFTALRSTTGTYASGGTDTITTPSSEIYVYQGVLEEYVGPSITFDDLDGSAVALTVGNEYIAVVALTSGDTVSITKGDQATAGSAIAPATPAGDIKRVEVVVPFGLAINSITIFPARAFFGFEDLGGLDGQVTRGQGFAGDYLILAETDTDLTLTDDSTTRIYIDPSTGGPELVVLPGSPGDSRAMPIWEIMTAGGDITSIIDLRQIGPPGANGGAPMLNATQALYKTLFNISEAALLSSTFQTRRITGLNDVTPTASFAPNHYYTLPTPTLTTVDATVDLEVASTSANDTAAGTGARTVEITWIDGSFQEQVSVVTLNGQTPVAIGTGYAINDMRVVTSGSSNDNEGLVQVGATGDFTAGAPNTNIYGGIQAVLAGGTDLSPNRSQNAHFAVPTGWECAILRFKQISGDGGRIRIRITRPQSASADRTPVLELFTTAEANMSDEELQVGQAFAPLPAETWITVDGNINAAGTDRVQSIVDLVLRQVP